MLRVTVWMNMPSFHQSGLFRALVDTGEVDLHVVFAHEMTNDRRMMGWADDVTGYSSTFLSRRYGPLDALRVAWRQRDRIHIVNGLWAEPTFIAALCALAVHRSSYLIYSEAPNPKMHRSMIKKMIQATLGWTFATRASGWLPVSRFAIEFYESLGARREAMYPFGYFRATPSHVVPLNAGAVHSPYITAIFVGQLIERKGLDVLLTAASTVSGISLRVIGDGAMRPAFERQVKALGMEDRVVFEGVLPAAAIPERIARADVLILPSRWDGWGLVVNEALSVGVPVIVSDRCGAAEVLRHGVSGYVFRSGDVKDLAECLRRFHASHDARLQMCRAARYVGERLAAETVAPYLLGCLRHMLGEISTRPVPPWEVAETGYGSKSPGGTEGGEKST